MVAVEQLCKHFGQRKGIFARNSLTLKAVDHVSFDIPEGETLGLIGESGCGKTTCGLTLLHLLRPTAGKVVINQQEVFTLTRREKQRFRRNAQIVFQEPQESLDPRMRIQNILLEPLIIHNTNTSKAEREDLLMKIIAHVNLRKEHLRRLPRELSGGQQQRVSICRALILRPKFVVLDEPTSSLDVSVQARILNLLLDLKRDFSLTYLFISHDAAVVRYVADRVGVMYLGNIVELADADNIFDDPLHPYTEALCESILTPESQIHEKQVLLKGSPPTVEQLIPGCVFQDRCTVSLDVCKRGATPALRQAKEGHYVACHR